MKPVLIWVYHRILPENGNASVSADIFDQQVEYLLSKDYTFISANKLQDWFNGKFDEKRKYAVLTFDDGWGDNLFWATPVLEKYAIKAVLALNTGLINPENKRRNIGDYQIIDSKQALEDAAQDRNYHSFLTWPEIQEMADSGLWEVHAHGNTHLGCYRSLRKIRGFYPEKKHWTMEYALGEAPFTGAPCVKFTSTLCEPRTKLNPELCQSLRNSQNNKERLELCHKHSKPIISMENKEEFKKRVSEDLAVCKNLIKEKTGHDSESFFWPWGQSSETGREIAKACGFKLLFTVEKDAVSAKIKTDMIPRIPAPTDLAHFKKREIIFANNILRKVYQVFK